MQRSTYRQSVNVLQLKFFEISYRILVPLIVLALFLYLTHFPGALAQASETVDPNTWITNGDVYAVAPSGNTVYIGGDFSYVGPNNEQGSCWANVSKIAQFRYMLPVDGGWRPPCL
jgi:hypothetical protein